MYSLIKDENVRREYEFLTKQEKYSKNLPLKSENVKTGIIKNVAFEFSKGECYQFEVAPNGENKKQILVIPQNTYQYITQLGVIAYLKEYEIVKNINGMEMHFVVTTNTRFDEVNMLLHERELRTEEEKAYIILFYNQMSDIHLTTCQRKFDGYIGTVENNLNGPTFDMNDEDLATTKLIRQRKREEKR